MSDPRRAPTPTPYPVSIIYFFIIHYKNFLLELGLQPRKRAMEDVANAQLGADSHRKEIVLLIQFSNTRGTSKVKDLTLIFFRAVMALRLEIEDAEV